MSYFPKKGMYRDGNGVARFLSKTVEQDPNAGKQWWRGEVVRKVMDKDGETLKRDKQTSTVFAREAEVPGLLVKRCPPEGTEWNSMNVYYRPLREGDEIL